MMMEAGFDATTRSFVSRLLLCLDPDEAIITRQPPANCIPTASNTHWPSYIFLHPNSKSLLFNTGTFECYHILSTPLPNYIFLYSKSKSLLFNIGTFEFYHILSTPLPNYIFLYPKSKSLLLHIGTFECYHVLSTRIQNVFQFNSIQMPYIEVEKSLSGNHICLTNTISYTYSLFTLRNARSPWRANFS